MRFSGYIFDVAGTLVDTVRPDLLSLQKALDDFGLQVPYESLQLYSGLDADQTLQLIAPALDEDARKRISRAYRNFYDETYLSTIKAFAGVRDVFEWLKQQGGKIALVTDCKGPELKQYLALLNIRDLIDCMACGDDVEHGKPDPRLIGVALRKLGIPAAQTVMIGDTPYDAESASEAGAAGVLTRGFSKEVLMDAGCFIVTGQLHDLPFLRNTPPTLSLASGE